MAQHFRKVSAGLVKSDIDRFVGEVGNIFFGIDTGEFRLSDGVTPGGIPITGGFTLHPATNTTLGGVKIGSNISVTTDGTISVAHIPTDLSELTDNTNILRNTHVIISDTPPVSPTEGALWWNGYEGNLYIFYDNDWVLTIAVGSIEGYQLPPATNSTLGGVKIGTNINVTTDGTISVPKGAGINTVIDIPDVNYTAGGASLTDGALLVYNASSERWDVINSLRSDTVDGGFF